MKTNQFGTYKALLRYSVKEKNNVKNKSSFFFYSIEYITQMLDTYYFIILIKRKVGYYLKHRLKGLTVHKIYKIYKITVF